MNEKDAALARAWLAAPGMKDRRKLVLAPVARTVAAARAVTPQIFANGMDLEAAGKWGFHWLGLINDVLVAAYPDQSMGNDAVTREATARFLAEAPRG